MFRHRIYAWIAGFLALLFVYFFVGFPIVNTHQDYGVTWSTVYANELGINANAGLAAVLDDLGVRRFRIPAYWNEIEPRKGEFTFGEITWELDQIAARGGKAIVSVGATQPRWPECWLPDWIQHKTAQEREKEQLAYVRRTVEELKNHPALLSWQVENESTLFLFGECKDQRLGFVREEIAAVREIENNTFAEKDRHPIVTTDAGEISTWLSYPGILDGKGVSVYRSVLSPRVGRIHYPIPAWFYARKAALVAPFVGPLYVSEFQMEPWETQSLTSLPLEKQFADFSLEDLKSSFEYATWIGLPHIDFWGAEWWYWLKESKGRPEFWNEARAFFQKHRAK